MRQTHKKTKKKLFFLKKKFVSYKFKDKIFDKKLLEKLVNTDYILVSIPPQKYNDIVLKTLKNIY